MNRMTGLIVVGGLMAAMALRGIPVAMPVDAGETVDAVPFVVETSYAPAVRIMSESEARLMGSGTITLNFSSGAKIEAINREAKAYAWPDFEVSTLTTAEGERLNLAMLVEEHRMLAKIREVIGEPQAKGVVGSGGIYFFEPTINAREGETWARDEK